MSFGFRLRRFTNKFYLLRSCTSPGSSTISMLLFITKIQMVVFVLDSITRNSSKYLTICQCMQELKLKFIRIHPEKRPMWSASQNIILEYNCWFTWLIIMVIYQHEQFSFQLYIIPMQQYGTLSHSSNDAIKNNENNTKNQLRQQIATLYKCFGVWNIANGMDEYREFHS